MRSVKQNAALCCGCVAAALAVFFSPLPGNGQTKTVPKTVPKTKTAAKPAHAALLSGYEKVVSTADGKKSLYTIWTRKKDNQMIAELPANFASQRYFFALTVSSGERFAGLQTGDLYVYWRQYNKQLALIQPNVGTRSTGDAESKASVKRLYTDKIL
ncbi:MAG: hypothetical protein IID45_14770, partial [Planctomycetes bacterium]|nr:hypothetical protein [Planctomycetota bacterium]